MSAARRHGAGAGPASGVAATAAHDAPAAAPPPIAEGQVHVWWFDLSDAPDPAAAPPPSAVDEAERAARMASPSERVAFLRHRARLRSTLAAYLPEAAATSLACEVAQGGRPWAPALRRRGLAFSSGRRGAVGVVAVACGIDVGVDVEVRRPDLPFSRIADEVLDASDRARIARAADPEAAFFEAWTHHEARVKLWGLGLAEAAARRARGEGVPPAYVVQTLAAPPGYAAALAASREPARVTVLGGRTPSV